jgi:hypothetical protein
VQHVHANTQQQVNLMNERKHSPADYGDEHGGCAEQHAHTYAYQNTVEGEPKKRKHSPADCGDEHGGRAEQHVHAKVQQRVDLGGELPEDGGKQATLLPASSTSEQLHCVPNLSWFEIRLVKLRLRLRANIELRAYSI